MTRFESFTNKKYSALKTIQEFKSRLKSYNLRGVIVIVCALNIQRPKKTWMDGAVCNPLGVHKCK